MPKLWPKIEIQDGGRPPSWICYVITSDHPQSPFKTYNRACDSTPTVLTVSVDTWHDKSCVLLLLFIVSRALFPFVFVGHSTQNVKFQIWN